MPDKSLYEWRGLKEAVVRGVDVSTKLVQPLYGASKKILPVAIFSLRLEEESGYW